MKKQFIQLAAITLTAATMAMNLSCKDDKEENPTLSVTPTVKDILFAANGKSATSGGSTTSTTFTVETNQDKWEVNRDKDWVHITTSGNQFAITADEVTVTTAPEDAVVTVSAGKATPVTISVRQLAVAPSLEVDPFARAVELSVDGESAAIDGKAFSPPTFKVLTNMGTWKAESNRQWLTVNENQQNKTFTLIAGLNTSAEALEATVTVTAGQASVVIAVTQVALIPITGISVSPSSLDLAVNANATLTTSLQPITFNEPGNNTLLWQTSDPNVATVTNGVVTAVGGGSAVITVKLERNQSILKEIPVAVFDVVMDISTFTTSGDFLFKEVSFNQWDKVKITGIDESMVEEAFNRDFFNYNTDTKILTFIGESGTWEVYFSSKYKYFWIMRMDDRAPVAYWILGQHYSCAPQWNDDFAVGWSQTDIKQIGYLKSIGDGKYQVSCFLTMWSAVIIVPVRTEWNAVRPTLTGDIAQLDYLGPAPNCNIGPIVDPSIFDVCYYRITYDTVNNTLDFEYNPNYY